MMPVIRARLHLRRSGPYLAASKHFLNHYREAIQETHQSGASGELVVENITAMTDTLITKLFRCISGDMLSSRKAGEQLTLVAIGGYGRGELNPFSDIDLMFLHSGKDPPANRGYCPEASLFSLGHAARCRLFGQNSQ